jgi:hypothetical protein
MREWSFVLIGLAACGTNGTGPDGGGPDAGGVLTCNTPEPLSACATGWQFAPFPTLPGTCPCSLDNKPECANADCEQLQATGYLDGGVEVVASLYYSAEAGTMSTYASVTQGQWSVVDGGLMETMTGGPKFACATCDSAGGVCYVACYADYQTQIPASPGWSASLNAALAAGPAWTAWPVTP